MALAYDLLLLLELHDLILLLQELPHVFDFPVPILQNLLLHVDGL